ncbi:MAG: enoyl-CoA hydratase/isomerase family protein [Thermodesulfobacteriota bacterium]
MEMFSYELDEHVALLTMKSGENRFTLDFLDAFLNILDEIENKTPATVLVVKSADAKIWSNGIDLDWLRPAVEEKPELGRRFSTRIMDLLRRILTYPLITIAAINGHAFAGGAILACAFDFRFMRTDRGFFCFPEVDIHIPFLPGMDALIKKALPGHLSLEAQLTGKRYTAAELETHKAIYKACHLNDLMNEVMAFAKAMNKGRDILKPIKAVGFKSILRVMEVDDPAYLAARQNGSAV